jgi:uncharacterized protein YybS (DUF2232 family)|tara:strand:- start:305 stop:523 length:219 start_codon:yes stop_codon:yes gene_type:complete
MMQKDFTISIGNIIWIIGIIFTMGTAYSQIGQLDEDIKVLEQRLEKKIKVINENADRIVELEKELAKLKACD